MFSKLKSVILSIFVLFSLTSIANAMDASPKVTPIPLAKALEEGKKVAIFNVNDCFTDADSIQAFIESLLLGSQKRDQITQYFVTDDEANLSTVRDVVTGIKASACLKNESDAPIREHYQKYNAKHLSNTEPSKYAYRVQDTATLLFPLADRLGINISVIQGEISTNPTYNPYFGNFTNYTDNDLRFVKRIHEQIGSQAVIKAIEREIGLGKHIYVLNGGSFRLLSDLQEMAPKLLPHIDMTVMGFRQPMNFPPFTNPDRKWALPWNEGIDKVSTEKFIKFASHPNNPQFGAFRIVDSNTVEYGMVCDGKMHPLYKDYMTKLKPFVSEAAYKNLLDAEERHEKWSSFKTKLMDPILVFEAFGLAPIPRIQGKLMESEKDFCIRPTATDGFLAHYPNISNQHPYSCPRVNTQEEEEKNPDYANQYKSVVSFRQQLKNAHKTTWDLLEKI